MLAKVYNLLYAKEVQDIKKSAIGLVTLFVFAVTIAVMYIVVS